MAKTGALVKMRRDGGHPKKNMNVPGLDPRYIAWGPPGPLELGPDVGSRQHPKQLSGWLPGFGRPFLSDPTRTVSLQTTRSVGRRGDGRSNEGLA